MNWSLFLMNQSAEDMVAMQAGERLFTYNWLLILIALVAWMEPVDYQGMDVEAVKVCKGARYENMWWVEEYIRKEDCTIQFWVYWETLQEVAVKVPQLLEEAATKYHRIACFAIGLHTIHVQAWNDPDKQWLSMPYNLLDEELNMMVNDWFSAWWELSNTK